MFGDEIKFLYNNNLKQRVSASETIENVNMRWVNEERRFKYSTLLLMPIEVLKIPRNDTGNELTTGECETRTNSVERFAISLDEGSMTKMKNLWHFTIN